MDRRFAVALLSIVLTACVSREDLSAIEHSAAAFHQRQQAGDDAANYADAVPAFKAALSQADFARVEAAVRSAPGCAAPTRDPMNLRTNIDTSGSFVTVVYNRTCAGGAITETMTFQLINHAPHLAGYFVGGMALFPTGPTAAPKPPESASDFPQSSGTPVNKPN